MTAEVFVYLLFSARAWASDHAKTPKNRAKDEAEVEESTLPANWHHVLVEPH